MSEHDDSERQRLLRQAEKLQADAADLQDRWDDLAPRQPTRAAFPWRQLLDYAVPAALAGIVWYAYSLPVGLLAGLFGFLVMVNLPSSATGSRPAGGSGRAGSVSWEAEMAVGLLDNVIAMKEGERGQLEGDAAARMDRELAFLRRQREEKRSIAASGDLSPGEGYIAFQQYQGD